MKKNGIRSEWWKNFSNFFHGIFFSDRILLYNIHSDVTIALPKRVKINGQIPKFHEFRFRLFLTKIYGSLKLLLCFIYDSIASACVDPTCAMSILVIFIHKTSFPLISLLMLCTTTREFYYSSHDLRYLHRELHPSVLKPQKTFFDITQKFLILQ